MDDQVVRLRRLFHTVRAAADRPTTLTGGADHAAACNRLLGQVRSTISPDLQGEFDSLFAPIDVPRGAGHMHDPMALSAASEAAKTELTNLAGWLEGVLAVEQELHDRK